MIRKIRIVGEIAIVTATADFHPMRCLGQLEQELEGLAFRGGVLFDLLAVNGLAANRFCSINFNGEKFDRSTFVIESDIDPEIASEQDTNAKKDSTFLLGSVLSSGEIDKFRH